jgi:hypothetical protein
MNQLAFAVNRLEQVVVALQDIATKGRGTKSVVNLSLNIGSSGFSPSIKNALYVRCHLMPTLL